MTDSVRSLLASLRDGSASIDSVAPRIAAVIRSSRVPVDRENESWLDREARIDDGGTEYVNTFSEVQSACNLGHIGREQYDAILAELTGK